MTNISSNIDCWRLVHKDGVVLALFKSNGITETKWELFCGTEEECQTEIERLNLEVPDEI